MAEISSSIPVIPFSTLASSYTASFTQYKELRGKLAPFRPASHTELQYGLFRSPQTLAALRVAAADRFMRWREVARTLSEPSTSTPPPLSLYNSDGATRKDYSKKVWEASLSEDIARARRRTITSANSPLSERPNKSLMHHGTPCGGFAPMLDPLHLRSLMMLSITYFLPRSLRTRTMQRDSRRSEHDDIALTSNEDSVDPAKSTSTIRPSRYRAGSARKTTTGWRALRWGLAIVGVFCAGIGIGLALSGSA